MDETSPFVGSRCICGQVTLKYHSPAPVLHLHCCCADCRQAMEWIASIGGPPMKRAVTHIYYFRNDLALPDEHSLSRLYPVKLRDTGETTRLVTRCCHSLVAADHPYYEGNVFAVHPDLCVLSAPAISPLGRIFTAAWDQAHDGDMPEATAMLTDISIDWVAFDRVVKHPVGPRRGVSLQDILAQLPPPVDLGLAEGARLFPPARP